MRYATFLAVSLLAIGCGSNVVGGSSSSGSTTGTTTTGTTGTAASTSTTGTGGSGSTTGSATGSSGSTGATLPRPTYPASSGQVAVGSVMPNFQFQGYVKDSSGVRIDTVSSWSPTDLQAVRNIVNAQKNKPYNYLLLDLSAGWCNPCNIEAESLGLNSDATDGTMVGQWLAGGGLYLTVLVQNYNESSPSPPTEADIGTWLNAHNVQSLLGGDVDGNLSGIGLTQSAFPANLIIDLDTMQIVSAWYGTATSQQLDSFTTQLAAKSW